MSRRVDVSWIWAWSILPILKANALHKSSIDSLSICHTLCYFKPWFWSLLRNSLFEFQELPREWKDFTKTLWKNHFLEKVKLPILRWNGLYFLLLSFYRRGKLKIWLFMWFGVWNSIHLHRDKSKKMTVKTFCALRLRVREQ